MTDLASVIPIGFQLDTKSVTDIPIGQKSASLKADSLVITTKKKLLYSYITAVEKAGVQVLDITIQMKIQQRNIIFIISTII